MKGEMGIQETSVIIKEIKLEAEVERVVNQEVVEVQDAIPTEIAPTTLNLSINSVKNNPEIATVMIYDSSQNRLKVNCDMLKFPKSALTKEDDNELKFILEKEYSMHNLDPNCPSCTQCDICYFPNRLKSRITEGKIKHFMNEIKLIKKEDGTEMFECKFLFNEKINQLPGNREYALLRA